jgi:protein tyrosine phosphatase (PTP) superfamily phosphohydrolase (DUF442 family)
MSGEFAAGVEAPLPEVAALSEVIEISGRLDEGAGLEMVGKYRSILYVATDKGDDVALAPNGFGSLEALARPGHCEVRHVPLTVNTLSFAQADAVVEALQAMARPTLVVCRCAPRG